MNDFQILDHMKAERDAMKQKFATMQPNDAAQTTSDYLIKQLDRQIVDLETRLQSEAKQ